MGEESPPADRRKPENQRKVRGGRRESDRFWTVPEIADELGLTARTVWRKFMRPVEGERLLEYYDFEGTIRVHDADFQAFKARHFRPRTLKPAALKTHLGPPARDEDLAS